MCFLGEKTLGTIFQLYQQSWKMNNKKHIAKKVISVADAVAMNAVPEHWLSLKHAGLHVISLLTMAKLFLIGQGINQ
jgi:hypothetical protein